MKILSIETSCDETSVSIIEAITFENKVSFSILSTITLSQIALHEKFGGVFPTMAKREHAKNLPILIKQSLLEAKIEIKEQNISEELERDIREILHREPESIDAFLSIASQWSEVLIDYVAVTYGPGLEPALWVGINGAKVLSRIWNVPIIPVDHMEGHILSILIGENEKKEYTTLDKNSIQFPVLSLLVSGGHTEFILSESWLSYKKIGKTRDDAIGEAFDKVARILGLPYPGGPKISALADEERTLFIKPRVEIVSYPRPMIYTDDLDVSYSGLKTAVLYDVQSKEKHNTLNEETKRAIAREFEDAAIEVLVKKTKKALETYNIQTLIIAGGVASNNHLRREFEKLISNFDYPIELLFPTKNLSTDNSLMIAVAGYFNIEDGRETYQYSNSTKKSPNEIQALGNLVLT